MRVRVRAAIRGVAACCLAAAVQALTPHAWAAPPASRASIVRRAVAAPLGATLTLPGDPLLGARPFPAHVVAAGRTLLMCDTPEVVHGPGVLYRDRVDGPFRVYLYALSGAAAPLRYAVVATNPGAAAVTVRLTRAGAAGPSSELHAVAVAAERHYFASGSPPAVTVPPHATVELRGLLPAQKAHAGQLVNAIIDGSTSAGVVLTVAATARDHGTRWLRLPVLPPGPGRYLRGTFPNADFNIAVSGHGDARYLLVGQRPRYLHGYSAVDHRAVVDYGNFGALYTVEIYEWPPPAGNGASGARALLSLPAPPADLALLFMERAVTYAGMVVLAGGGNRPAQPVVLADGPNGGLTREQAVVIGRFPSRVSGLTFIRLQWMPAGASTLPAAFLVQPV